MCDRKELADRSIGRIRGGVMPALNYQERFAPKVESGEKRNTIRPRRKREIKPGDTLYHYTGMRTKRCRKLRTAVCLSVTKTTIASDHVSKYALKEFGLFIWVPAQLKRFAREDGFDSWKEMRDWFDKKYGLPFEGVLITW